MIHCCHARGRAAATVFLTSLAAVALGTIVETSLPNVAQGVREASPRVWERVIDRCEAVVGRETRILRNVHKMTLQARHLRAAADSIGERASIDCGGKLRSPKIVPDKRHPRVLSGEVNADDELQSEYEYEYELGEAALQITGGQISEYEYEYEQEPAHHYNVSIAVANALRTFFNATGGRNPGCWKSAAGWNNPVSDPCNDAWYGVHCRNGAVRSLKLGNNNLCGSLPDSLLLQLTDLRKLDLSNNPNLGGTLPAALPVSLRYLDLCCNPTLRGTLPSGYGLMRNIEILYIDHLPEVRGTLPASWGALSNAVTINLDSNTGLSGSIPSTYGALTNVEDLYLSNNEGLKGSLPSQPVQGPSETQPGLFALVVIWSLALDRFGNMEKVKNLELLNNPQLTGDLPSQYGKLGRMTDFDMSFNDGLSGSFPSQWGRLTGLLNVYLHDMPGVVGSLPTEWGNLVNAEEFHLDENVGLTGTLPPSYASLTSATTFRLSTSAGLRGTIPSVYAKLTNLKYLEISGCSITGTIPSDFHSLVSLVELDLRDNNLRGGLPKEWRDQIDPSVDLVWDYRDEDDVKYFWYQGNDIAEGEADEVVGFAFRDARHNRPNPALPNLRALRLTRNRLNTSVGDFMRATSTLRSLAIIDVGYNELHGSIDSHDILAVTLKHNDSRHEPDLVNKLAFPSLFRLVLDGNPITGLPRISISTLLQTVSARGTALAGPLNVSILAAPILDLRQNPALQFANGSLPPGIIVDLSAWTALANASASCAGVKSGNPSESVVWRFDPSIDGYARCMCDAGQWCHTQRTRQGAPIYLIHIFACCAAFTQSSGFAGQRGICTPCPRDTYMPMSGLDRYVKAKTKCFPCPVHSSTESSDGAVAISACACDPGYELVSTEPFVCAECEFGFFKARRGVFPCEACPKFSVGNTMTGASSCVCPESFVPERSTSPPPIGDTNVTTATLLRCTCDVDHYLSLATGRCTRCNAGFTKEILGTDKTLCLYTDGEYTSMVFLGTFVFFVVAVCIVGLAFFRRNKKAFSTLKMLTKKGGTLHKLLIVTVELTDILTDSLALNNVVRNPKLRDFHIPYAVVVAFAFSVAVYVLVKRSWQLWRHLRPSCSRTSIRRLPSTCTHQLEDENLHGFTDATKTAMIRAVSNGVDTVFAHNTTHDDSSMAKARICALLENELTIQHRLAVEADYDKLKKECKRKRLSLMLLLAEDTPMFVLNLWLMLVFLDEISAILLLSFAFNCVLLGVKVPLMRAVAKIEVRRIEVRQIRNATEWLSKRTKKLRENIPSACREIAKKHTPALDSHRHPSPVSADRHAPSRSVWHPSSTVDISNNQGFDGSPPVRNSASDKTAHHEDISVFAKDAVSGSGPCIMPSSLSRANDQHPFYVTGMPPNFSCQRQPGVSSSSEPPPETQAELDLL